MSRWSLTVSPEIHAWLRGLDDPAFGRVAYYLDLLCERRGALPPPLARWLGCDPAIRELVVPNGRRGGHRITYCVEHEGALVALTVRRWWRGRRWETRRAAAALHRHHGHAGGYGTGHTPREEPT